MCVRIFVCAFVKLGYKRAQSGSLWGTKLLCVTTDTVSWT